MTDYIYDTNTDLERDRLRGLQANLDPGTIRIFETIGVSEGWRCLEIGGGGGSMTRWLCNAVGPRGAVVATDLNPRFLREIEADNLDVRTHDIVSDPLEVESFNLVHVRDVLEHIPEREAVLEKLVAAVRPGGWLFIEDVDFATAVFADPAQTFATAGSPSGVIAKQWQAAEKGMRTVGIDPEFGRRLPRALIDLGLSDVDAEIRSGLIRGASERAAVAKLSVTHLRGMLVSTGLITDAEIDEILALLDDPASASFGPLHVSAWGRKLA